MNIVVSESKFRSKKKVENQRESKGEDLVSKEERGREKEETW